MAKSVAEMACARLDAKIAELQAEIDGLTRAKAIVLAADETTAAPTGKKRGRKRKAGLPAEQTTGE